MDAARNYCILQETIAGAAAAVQDLRKDEWNRNSNSFWTLPQAILQH